MFQFLKDLAVGVLLLTLLLVVFVGGIWFLVWALFNHTAPFVGAVALGIAYVLGKEWRENK